MYLYSYTYTYVWGVRALLYSRAMKKKVILEGLFFFFFLILSLSFVSQLFVLSHLDLSYKGRNKQVIMEKNRKAVC